MISLLQIFVCLFVCPPKHYIIIYIYLLSNCSPRVITPASTTQSHYYYVRWADCEYPAIASLAVIWVLGELYCLYSPVYGGGDSTVQHPVQYSILQYSTAPYSTIQIYIIQYKTVQFTTAPYRTVRQNTVR